MKVELTKQDKRFEAVRFVCQAASKEPSRYAIAYVKIEPDVVVATDGHRLHICRCEHSWDCGLYEVIKLTKTKLIVLKADDENCRFPKWRDIVPYYNTYFRLCPSYKGFFVSKLVGCLAKLNIGINLDYLKPLTEIEHEWRIGYYGPDHPIYCSCQTFNNIGLCAVITPVNLAYNEVKFVKECSWVTACA